MPNASFHSLSRRAARTTASTLILGLAACSLAPREAALERARMTRAGAPYARSFEARTLPALPASPSWRDVRARTLLANGELEAAYFAWAAAVHRIDAAAAYPNTPLSLDFARAFSGGGTGFDRTSLGLGFDPMENLAFPSKVVAAAKVATADARAAGERLLAVKFDLQRRARNAWLDYALLAEQARIGRERVAAQRLLAETATARVAVGGGNDELLRSTSALRMAENDLATVRAALPSAQAGLNALMARAADAPLAPPVALEPARPLPADDAAVLRAAADTSPDLRAFAHDVRGRRDALTLARLQYIPDFNPFVGTDGAASQMAGVVISIPTMLREVGARIRENRAELDAMLARERQAGFDRAAAVVAALVVARDSERQAALFAGPLRQAAEAVAARAALARPDDSGGLAALLAAQQAVRDVRLLAAEAATAREKALADLEALVGVDVETLAEVRS